jgi:predicted outer membrane repeat protein
LSNTRSCAVVNVLTSQNLSSPVLVAPTQNLTVIGKKTTLSSIYIWCTNSSGIAFVSAQHVQIETLNFVGCGARWNFTAYYAGVFFYQGSNVEVKNCSFSHGAGIGVIMYDVTGINQVRGSRFIGNKPKTGQAKNVTVFGGLLIMRMHIGGVAVYRVETCLFNENENYVHVDHRDQVLLGGGMTLYLAAPSSNSNVTISSDFFSNVGGGVRINQDGGFSFVNVTDSRFFSNQLMEIAGGGIYLEQNRGSCSLNITHSFFYNNTGAWGGGLAVYNAYSNGSVDVYAYNSYWTANSANSGGFAVGFSVRDENKAQPTNRTVFQLSGYFDSCVFWYHNFNGSTPISLVSVGAVSLQGSKAEFYNSSFFRTFGTGLHLIDFSYAILSGNSSFRHNTNAVKGGAIFMDRSSVIALKSHGTPSVVQFENNSAVMEGGAIYSEEVGGLDMENHNCVFESLGSLSSTLKVNFSYNLANSEDRAIFIGSPRGCFDGQDKNLLFDSAIFSYHPNITSQVSSYANDISFGSHPPMKGGILEVMLGELFYLLPNARDIFNNSAHKSGSLELLPSDYHLIGPSFIGIDNFTQNSELYITGPNCTSTPIQLHFIYRKQSSYHSGDVKLDIRLVECRIGFRYNITSQMCQCNPHKTLLCPDQRSYACVQYGYWYGQYDNESGGEPVECPWMNCGFDNGNCPGEECPSYTGFCRLDAVDDLCFGGRSGILCSSCQKDHAFTFGGLSCVPTHTCPPGITALIVLGVLFYWVIFVVFLLFLLNVNLSIGSGFMYGIVYYFSIQSLFTESSVTENFLMVLVDTCIAATQLSPRMFGNIPACFAPSWDLNLHHRLFHFASPVFVIVVIIVVILASRYCRCPRSISLAENSPIHAICMLTLFSYTSMVYTIFYILKPIKIKGEMRVFIDPHLKYFHEDHLPYAIVALACEFLLVLPVCILLLSAPWLSQRVNLVRLRLKPILDEFQACYRPRYRWFAGFYFLARQLVFLAYIVPVDQENNTFIRGANALVLIIHSICQPYKLWWLNLLDTLLLFDLLLLSFFQLEVASSFMHKVIPYLLILPPCIYLISVILLVMLNRVLYCLQHIKFFKKMIGYQNTELPSTIRSVITRTSVGINEDEPDLEPRYEGSFFHDQGEREPLLSGPVSPQTDSGMRRAVTTTTVGLRVDGSTAQRSKTD